MTGRTRPGRRRAPRGDDTSSDEEADFVSKSNAVQARFKRVRSGARAHTEKLVGVDVSDSDEDDFPPTQVIFCSRTHSQLTQVVGELRSTAFGRVAGAAAARRTDARVGGGRRGPAPAVRQPRRARDRGRVRVAAQRAVPRARRGGGRREGRRAGARRRRRRATDAADATSLKTSRKRKRKRVSFPSQAPRHGRRARGGGFGDPDGHRGFGERGREAPGVSVLRGARGAPAPDLLRATRLFCTRRRATRWAYD